MHGIRGIDWLFFDIGNTLIDEDGPSAQRVADLQRALSSRSMRRSREEIESAILQACTEFAPRPIARATEILAGDIPIEHILKEAPYRKEQERPYPETLPVLRQLSTCYHLGIIGNQSPGTWTRLQAWGLSQFFSVCIASAEEGIAKPDLEIFRRALERADCFPGRAVMIGDCIDNDIVPAKQLGMMTVRVLQGWMNIQVPRSEEETADFTVADRWELLPIFFHRKEIPSHD